MTLAFSFSPTSRLALVGAGKMGGALLKGWLDNGLDKRSVLVVDPAPPPDSVDFLAQAGISVHPSVPGGATAKVIVIAVKPQIIADVLPALRPLIGRDTIALSIAAGTTLKQLGAGVGDIAVVRSIPNTPAQVGRGITVAIANPRVDKAAQALVTTLLEAVGEVVWVDKEGMIDSATAVSGSGPAYVFHMVEALAAAAVSVGFDKTAAEKLARATVEGAGELLYQSDLGADVLRQNVTSPKGTTAAALKVLMARGGGLTPLMKKAVAAARKRSRELAK
ncbi:MAG TPA: pyrroline-5-carboxylate reductase [Bauldia sp.]|nr:pyrroline-5-carboxylate reductase [Bauldia sp.]